MQANEGQPRTMAEYITPDADADVTMGEVSGAAPPGEVVTAAYRLVADSAREITYPAHSRHFMTCEIFGKELAGIIPTDADGRNKLIERAVKRFDDGDLDDVDLELPKKTLREIIASEPRFAASLPDSPPAKDPFGVSLEMLRKKTLTAAVGAVEHDGARAVILEAVVDAYVDWHKGFFKPVVGRAFLAKAAGRAEVSTHELPVEYLEDIEVPRPASRSRPRPKQPRGSRRRPSSAGSSTRRDF